MKERKENIDFWKIICCLSVIILHVSAEHLFDVEYGTPTSMILNFGHGITRFAVTNFFLISGMLYLSDSLIVQINKKHIQKIVKYFFIYYIYSIGYASCALLFSHKLNGNILNIITNILNHSFSSPKYHLWYIPAYVGVLIAVPLIKMMLNSSSNDKKLMHYILFFSILFMITNSLDAFGIDFIKSFNVTLKNFKIDLVSSWIGIVVLGHYLDKYPIKHFKLFGFFTILLFSLTMIASYWYKGHIETLFYENGTLPTTMWSAFLFHIIIHDVKWAFLEKHRSILLKLSSMTLGIYLIHPLVLNILEILNINSLMFNPIIAIPIVGIIAFIISAIIVCILKHIPILNKILI